MQLVVFRNDCMQHCVCFATMEYTFENGKHIQNIELRLDSNIGMKIGTTTTTTTTTTQVRTIRSVLKNRR